MRPERPSTSAAPGFGSAEIVSGHITHADGTPETGEGHQPWEVRANGSRADLQAGDIILAVIVNGVTNEVKSVEQFNKLAAQFEKGTNVTLLIRRGENQSFITLKGADKQG